MEKIHKITTHTISWTLLTACMEKKSKRFFDNIIVIDNSLYGTDGRILARITPENYTLKDNEQLMNGFYKIIETIKSTPFTGITLLHIPDHEPPKVQPFFENWQYRTQTANIALGFLKDFSISTKREDNEHQITSLICNAMVSEDELNECAKLECEKRESIGTTISLKNAQKLKGFEGSCYFNKEKNRYHLESNDIQIIIMPMII